MEFAFDQTLRPTILLEATKLQCFAALPTKLSPESSHVRFSLKKFGTAIKPLLQQLFHHKYIL